MRTMWFLFLLGTTTMLGAQVLFMPKDPEVQSLEAALLSAGELYPHDGYPQSLATLLKVQNERLPGSDILPPLKTGVYGRWAGNLTAQLFLSGPRDPFWSSWDKLAPDSKPLFRAQLGAMDEGRWALYFQGDFSRDFAGWEPTNLTWPRSDNFFPLEFHFFDKGYLWYNFDPLTVEIGRDQVHLGALESSLLISQDIPFLDMVHIQLPVGDWAFDWVVSTPETRTNGATNVKDEVLLSYHRIQWNPTRWLHLHYAESYIVANQDIHGSPRPFYLADLLPASNFHQTDIAPNNACETAGIEWAPLPGWRLMSELGYDDINCTFLGIPDYGIPSIWAFILGTELVGQWEGWNWRVYGESGYTHYLWGNFDDNYPTAKAKYLIILNPGTESMPLSSPFGPGTFWIKARLGISDPHWDLRLILDLWNTKDGVTLDIPYRPDPGLEGLGSTWNTRLRLKGAWTPDKSWEFDVQPGLLAKNLELVPELNLGVSWKWDSSPRQRIARTTD